MGNCIIGINAIRDRMPIAKFTGFRIASINKKKADIVVDMLITNLNPFPIPIIDINYFIEGKGMKLASGSIPGAVTIQLGSSTTIKIPVTLICSEIIGFCNNIKPGSKIPYRIKADIVIGVPIIGRLTWPVEMTGEVLVPYKPEVDLVKVQLERVSSEEISAAVRLKVKNKNDFELRLNVMECRVLLSNVRIGSVELAKRTTVGKNSVSFIEITMTLKPKDIGVALMNMIRGKGIRYSVKGNINIDTPFGSPLEVPFSIDG